MILKPECLVCLFSQTLRVCQHLKVDEAKAKEILALIANDIDSFNTHITPPEAASIIYPQIAKALGLDDLYADIKKESTQKASTLIPVAQKYIQGDKVLFALKASVAGNVIDYASDIMFDIEQEIANIFHKPFDIDDSATFKEKLSYAKEVLVIGDNVGEHLFDKLLIETLKALYPDITFYFAVRGMPIINDVTLKDGEALSDVATIIDSGVDTAGAILSRVSQEYKSIFERADIILSKGMGNFEVLNEHFDARLFFLFKVKCSVVANEVQKPIGSTIFKQNKGANDE